MVPIWILTVQLLALGNPLLPCVLRIVVKGQGPKVERYLRGRAKIWGLGFRVLKQRHLQGQAKV